jgi:phosphohistidine phosphatase SixA
MKRILFYCGVASLIIVISQCKSEPKVEDIASYADKYIDKIEKNTIYFEDGSKLPIDEKKYLKTFFLIRHAEKDTAKVADPLLTPEGMKRSFRLADILRGFRIDAIYSTMTSRTLYTVDSIADLKGLPTYPYEAKQLKETVEKIRNSLNQHNILIVGHSNTIPVLANYIYGSNFYNKIFEESDYDNMIVIFENVDSSKIFLPLKYK